MSWPEYIVQIEPHKEGDLYHMRGEPEPIVRCFDCEHFQLRKKFIPTEDGETITKTEVKCKRTKLETQPLGFCAWGESKDESTR